MARIPRGSIAFARVRRAPSPHYLAALLAAVFAALALPVATAEAGSSGRDKSGYYVEFRGRMGTPSGHSYVVVGKRRGRNLAPLRSAGFYVEDRQASLAGLLGGAPGVVKPSPRDRRHPPLATYRVNIGVGSYRRLSRLIDRAARKPPTYKVFGNNCNSFVRQAAQTIGLEAPPNTLALPPAYIADLKALNNGPSLDATADPLARSDIDNARTILQGL